MKQFEFAERIVGLKILNIEHWLNLVGIVFGECATNDKTQLLDNSYGVQITCPWIICNEITGAILAASGDAFSIPKDLTKIKGHISQWQMCYTNLDEKLRELLKDEFYVEDIQISACGDLNVRFSNQMMLYTFTDFSNEQCGWWFYKCGGAYTAPLQKTTFEREIITYSNEWWLLKFKGDRLYFCSENMKQVGVNWVMQDVTQNHQKSVTRKKLVELNLIGGEIIELGRAKEELLKDAPITWLKIKVPNLENVDQIYIIYLYCPWRIRHRQNAKILAGTADMRANVCWDDSILPSLRREDFYEEKKKMIMSFKRIITDIYCFDKDNFGLEIDNQYCMDFFINHSTDAVCWRVYCLNQQIYYEGGKNFFELHRVPVLNCQSDDIRHCEQWVNELVGNELVDISRKGNYYALTFSEKHSSFTENVENKTGFIQLICAQQWRLFDLGTQRVFVGGEDCYYPCAQLEGEDNDRINWLETNNTRYDERSLSVFKKKMRIKRIVLTQTADLKIYFDNDMVFEYFVHSSCGQEEWQFRRSKGEKLKAYGNAIELIDSKRNERITWMDTIRINPREKNDRTEVYEDLYTEKLQIISSEILDLQALIGKSWSPRIMESINSPWRIRSSKGEILIGTGDLEIPGKNVEWVDFFENGRGRSHFDDICETIKENKAIIQSVKILASGDVIFSMSNGNYLEIFQNH